MRATGVWCSKESTNSLNCYQLHVSKIAQHALGSKKEHELKQSINDNKHGQKKSGLL